VSRFHHKEPNQLSYTQFASFSEVTTVAPWNIPNVPDISHKLRGGKLDLHENNKTE